MRSNYGISILNSVINGTVTMNPNSRSNAFTDFFNRTVRLILLVLLIWPVSARVQEITLNLQDADIHALISTVAEVTGTNFVIDPRVTGKVTVISSQPMSHEELYDVFLSILDVHGFSAVGSGEVIKIVPNVNAKTSGVVAGAAPTDIVGGDIVTEVVEVRNVSAQQILPALRPLVPQYAHLAAFPNSGILVISDHSYNVERIKALIRRVDVVTGAEAELIKLENASAEELAGALTALQSSVGNSLQGVDFIADVRTNSILLSGEQSGRVRMRGVIAHLDMPTDGQSNTHVVYLKYATAEELAPLLAGTLESSADQGGVQTSIQADPHTNSLVISAARPVFNTLRETIRKLDVRRSQVLVEAIIADVSHDTADELGVQWLIDGSGDGSGPVAGTVFSSGGSNIADVAQSALGGDPIVSRGLSLAVGNLNRNGTSFAGLLRALTADVSTNILSTPSIMTLDNQEAEILVGQSVPFVTGQFTNTGAAAGSVNPFQTIEREDVGVSLKVTPQISESNTIKLDLHQEVSSISADSSTAGASDLVTDKRSIRTSVLVESNETLVLGGLIDNQTVTVEEKVPVLGSLPLVGSLFRFQSNERDKRKLMVFLKPEIVRTAADATLVTGGKYRSMRAAQLAQRLMAEEKFSSGLPVEILPKLDAEIDQR